MALAYTAPSWTDGSGTGISASQLNALSSCMQGLVQGSDKAIHSISMNNNVLTITFVDGTIETVTADVKGISSVVKTSTSGLVDTYTITYSDGTTNTFTITNGASSVTVRNNGTASSSATSVQQIGIDGVYTDVDGSKYMEQTITLSTSASVSATFTNGAILRTSLIDVFAGRASGDVSGQQNVFPYESIYTTSGSCAVTFPSFSSAIDLKVRIYIR